MSLLLDALKRAADAKRQQEDERIRLRTGQRRAISDAMLADAQARAPSDDEDLELAPLEHDRAGRPPPALDQDYRPPLSHAEAVAGVGEEQVDSQRVARCVFDSKKPFAGERFRRAFYSLAAVLVLAAGMSMGGLAFYQERDEQLRTQLAGVRAARVQALATANANTSTAAPDSPVSHPSPDSPSDAAPPPSTLREAATAGEQAARSAQPERAGGEARPPAARRPAAGVTAKPAARAQPAIAEPAPASAQAGPAADARAPIALDIVRGDRRERIGDALQGGYDAFQAGNLERAEVRYAEALSLDEDNRDALLGVAAIAVRRGDFAAAWTSYRRVLQGNPRDVVALAALADLPDKGSARARESDLKLLLRRYPRSAELHFALGRLYSAERRWAQAQAAFFEAHRNDAGNPDFMFNLAVALDHLNQAAVAREFYRRALQAAAGRAASFDREAVRQRLDALADHAG